MNKNNKKNNKSTISIICYAVSIFLLIYACFAAGDSIAYLKEYFAAYSMTLTDNIKQVFTYIMQATLTPLTTALIIFVGGKILSELNDLKAELACDCDECLCNLECGDDSVVVIEAADEVEADPAVEAAFSEKAEAETFEETVVDAETPADEVAAEVEHEAVDVSEFVEKEN